MMQLLLAALAGPLLASAALQPAPVPPSPWAVANPDWVAPTVPFRMIGNIYFVGTEGLSSFLLTGEKGHVLLDGGLPENAALILENIRTLGFDPADVRLLLNSHAHFDHSGGLAALKLATGAQLVASAGDRSALERGIYLGFEDNPSLNAPPVVVDRVVAAGEDIGGQGLPQLTARITPGHTRGCTSWWTRVEEGGEAFDVLLFCSATVAANRLVPEQYEGIVEDYRRTFAMTRDWRPDVYLSNHPVFFDMEKKRRRLEAGDPLAFVDRVGFPKDMARLEVAFEKALARQQAAASE